MKPICVPCQRFYRPERNGTPFVEGFPTQVPAAPGVPEHTARPGTSEADHWEPYKLWSGDLWICHGCGHHIIVGVAQLPVAEHYEADFAERVASLKATIRVNDC